jgi:hypothetical protein
MDKKGKEIMVDFGFTINDPKEEAKALGRVFEVVKPGWYPAAIVHSENHITSTGSECVILKFRLEDGTGRDVEQKIYTGKVKASALELSAARVAKIADCIGHKGKVGNTDPLMGRPLEIHIIIKKFLSNNTGEELESNEIVNYRPLTTKAVTQQDTPPNQGGTKPW